MGNVTTSMLIKGNNIFAPKLIPNVVDPKLRLRCKNQLQHV